MSSDPRVPIGAIVNKHPARCHRCYTWVKAGAGFVFKERPGGAWIGEHCACPETDGTNDPDGWTEDYPLFHE